MSAHDGRVISNFIVQAIRDEDITVYGDGSQTRSFCYVDDLIGGMMLMMDGPDDFIGPVNLGNPEEIPIRGLAEHIIALVGSHSRIVSLPLPQNDPVRRKPDISLAVGKLGWKPTVPLETGLVNTIEYFRRSMEV